MTVSELLTVLFPHLTCLDIDQVHRSGKSIRIRARTRTSQAARPGCETISAQVHGNYERRSSDTAVSGQETIVHPRVPRFRCGNDDCPKTTFAEQVPGPTIRYGRHSIRLRHVLQTIALTLGGRAGARLTHQLATAVSRMTPTRLIRSLPDPQPTSVPRVLGVDDFALRHGHAYGTILIDITTSRPVDVLFDRSADGLAAWLHTHPGVEVVCRDRAGRYAEGTSRGAPEAIQVADRWHLWRNLGEAVERTVTKHRAHLRNLASGTSQESLPLPSLVAVGPLPEPHRDGMRSGPPADRTRQRHAAVHHLLARGRDLRAIARELGLARNTVRRVPRAADPEELLVHNSTGKRPKLVEPFASYLRKRWEEGCTNAERLYQEITAMGYRGKGTALRTYVQPWRSQTSTIPPPQSPPSVRTATGRLLRHPDSLDADEQRQLNALTAACPPPAALRDHVRGFAGMMPQLRGD